MSRPGSRVGITGATYAATGGRGSEADRVGELALAKARTRAPGDEPPKTSDGLLVTGVSTGTERAEGGAGEKAFARSVSGDDFCSVPKGDWPLAFRMSRSRTALARSCPTAPISLKAEMRSSTCQVLFYRIAMSHVLVVSSFQLGRRCMFREALNCSRQAMS